MQVSFSALAPSQTSRRSQDFQYHSTSSSFEGGTTGRGRSEYRTSPNTYIISSQDRTEEQDTLRKALLQEQLAQHLRSIELPRSHASSLSHSAAATTTASRNQQRPAAVDSAVPGRSTAPDSYEQNYIEREPQSTPISQADLEALQEALEAHLEEQLARARLEGARMERERLEMEANRERLQASQRERQDVKPASRETVQRGRVERQIRGSNLAAHLPQDTRPRSTDEQDQLRRSRGQQEETIDTARIDRQRPITQQARQTLPSTDGQRLESVRLDEEAQERARRQRDQEAREREIILQQNREAVRISRLRSVGDRARREEHENATRDRQRLESEQRERERMDGRLTMEQQIAREVERAEPAHQGRLDRDVGNQAQHALDRVQDHASRQQSSGRLDSGLLDDIVTRIARLRSYTQQRDQLQQGPGRQDRDRGQTQQVVSNVREDNIVEDIESLWESVNTILPSTRNRSNLQGGVAQQPASGTRINGGVTTLQEVTANAGARQPIHTDYREPSPRLQDAPTIHLGPLPSTARAQPIPPPLVASNGGIIPSIPALAPMNSGLRTEPGSPPGGGFNLRNYRNSNLTISTPSEASARLLSLAESMESEVRDEGKGTDKTDLKSGENQGVSIGDGINGDSVSETNDGHTPPSFDVSRTQSPSLRPQSEVQKVPENNFQSDTSSEGHQEITANSGEPEEPSATGRQEMQQPSNPQKSQLVAMENELSKAGALPEWAKLATLEESQEELNNWMKKVLQNINRNDSIASLASLVGHMNEQAALMQDANLTKQQSMPVAESARNADTTAGTGQESSKATAPAQEDGAMSVGIDIGKSSALRSLAGIRKRTRYHSQDSNESFADAEEDLTNEFPVVQLSTSSSRAPPPGPQVPWSGALRPSATSGDSAGRHRASDGADYPNTPYRTYMYYPDPFSSPYSTHSYREDYGTTYNNLYYHDVSPKKVLSWREYMRRKEEKRAQEQRQAEERREPTIGVIETASTQELGIIPPVGRRSGIRSSYSTSSSQRQRSSTSQATSLATPTASQSSLSRTRVSFTPYSSISATQSASTPTRRY